MQGSPSRRSSSSISRRARKRNVPNEPSTAVSVPLTAARGHGSKTKRRPISMRDRCSTAQLETRASGNPQSADNRRTAATTAVTASKQNETQGPDDAVEIDDGEEMTLPANENASDFEVETYEIESVAEDTLMDIEELKLEPEEGEPLSEEQGFTEIDTLIDESIREHYPGRRREDWELGSSAVAEREAITKSRMKIAGEAIRFEVNADGEHIVAEVQALTETAQGQQKLERFSRARNQRPQSSSSIPHNRGELNTSLSVRRQISGCKRGVPPRQATAQQTCSAIDGIEGQMVVQQRDLDVYLNQLHYDIEHGLQAETTLARYTPIQRQFIVRFNYGSDVPLTLI
jgi:hypothetical protein